MLTYFQPITKFQDLTEKYTCVTPQILVTDDQIDDILTEECLCIRKLRTLPSQSTYMEVNDNYNLLSSSSIKYMLQCIKPTQKMLKRLEYVEHLEQLLNTVTTLEEKFYLAIENNVYMLQILEYQITKCQYYATDEHHVINVDIYSVIDTLLKNNNILMLSDIMDNRNLYPQFANLFDNVVRNENTQILKLLFERKFFDTGDSEKFFDVLYRMIKHNNKSIFLHVCFELLKKDELLYGMLSDWNEYCDNVDKFIRLYKFMIKHKYCSEVSIDLTDFWEVIEDDFLDFLLKNQIDCYVCCEPVDVKDISLDKLIRMKKYNVELVTD